MGWGSPQNALAIKSQSYPTLQCQWQPCQYGKHCILRWGGGSHKGLLKVREQMFSELQGHWKVGWDWALKLFSPSWPTQIHWTANPLGVTHIGQAPHLPLAKVATSPSASRGKPTSVSLREIHLFQRRNQWGFDMSAFLRVAALLLCPAEVL